MFERISYPSIYSCLESWPWQKCCRGQKNKNAYNVPRKTLGGTIFLRRNEHIGQQNWIISYQMRMHSLVSFRGCNNNVTLKNTFSNPRYHHGFTCSIPDPLERERLTFCENKISDLILQLIDDGFSWKNDKSLHLILTNDITIPLENYKYVTSYGIQLKCDGSVF